MFTQLDLSKFVFTGGDMAKLKRDTNILDVIELCIRERINTSRRFFKLTISTLFAVLLKNMPIGCTDKLLLQPVLKNRDFSCLTVERKKSEPCKSNFCLFGALALYLHGNQK